MKYYNAIDVGRVIAAILVICVHTDPLFSYSTNGNYFLVSVLARLAVPFFFIVSGFFFGQKLHDDQSFKGGLVVLTPILKRLITIYIVWMLIYLPMQFLAWIRSGASWTYWITFIQKSIFEGSYYTLWYLTGLIFAMAFSYVLFKIFSPKIVLILTLFLFMIGTLLQSYYDIWQVEELFASYYSIFLTTRNGLFFGSFFVSLGIYMARSKFELLQKWNITFFFLSFLLLLIEAFQVQYLDFSKGNGMWFMLVPATYFLFKVLQHMNLPDQSYFKYLRPFSLLVYVSHGLFLIVLNRLFHINSILYFSIVLILTCLLSAAIIYFSRRWKLLRLLF